MLIVAVYYHTLLLTFRPFLIFRGRLQKKKSEESDKGPIKIPPWLNEACSYALAAAKKTIHQLSEASRANGLVKVCHLSCGVTGI